MKSAWKIWWILSLSLGGFLTLGYQESSAQAGKPPWGPQIDVGPMPNITVPDTALVQISWEWTTFNAHRVNNYSPLEMLLEGQISTTAPTNINLSTIYPQAGSPPALYFVEDYLGHSGPAYGTDIPVTWEVSVDGGAFNPITILPNNTLSISFLPGPHAFQIRIIAGLQPCQGNGYYKLQLAQSISVQL